MATETDSGKLERIEVEEARRRIAGGEAQALDVRGQEAWRDAHIPGAVAAEESSIEGVTEDLDADQPVIIVADGDDPPDAIVSALNDGGFEVAVLKGGMDSWKSADFTIQPSDDVDEDAEPEEGSVPEASSAEDQPS